MLLSISQCGFAMVLAAEGVSNYEDDDNDGGHTNNWIQELNHE